MEINKTLKKLTLSHCRLTSSLTQLATSLKKNHTLKTLYLWGNNFHKNQSGCQAFHELFKSHNNVAGRGVGESVTGYIVSDFMKTDFELYIVDAIYHVAEVRKD